MTEIVEMMRAFGVHDPNVFFDMPVGTFDEVHLELIKIKKREAEMWKNYGKQKGVSFGGH